MPGLWNLSAFFSCGEIPPEGSYRGTLVMEDGALASPLKSFLTKRPVLQWTFLGNRPKALGKSKIRGWRVRGTIFGPLPVQGHPQAPEHRKEGLIVHEIAERIEGKTDLRPIKLQEAKPLLRQGLILKN